MRMTSEEATAFMAINQSILEPFLRGVSPPPRPPTPPTPEPLMMPPCYHNLSPKAPDYDLIDSVEFPLPPNAPQIPSPIETHVSYPSSPIPNDNDEFPDGNWPSEPPSPTASSNSDHVPVLQAFIEAMDDPVKARVKDADLVHDMALVLYEGS